MRSLNLTWCVLCDSQVHFECNGEGADDSLTADQNQHHIVDPMTGTRTIEALVNITRDHVEEYFGASFECTCVAMSSRGHVKSRAAKVQVACEYHLLITNPYETTRRESPIGLLIKIGI